MTKTINLASEIEKQLPEELVDFMRLAGKIASNQEQSLYLVGGVVRDLLLEQTNLDLDLVVEGNAIALAQQLTQTYHGSSAINPDLSRKNHHPPPFQHCQNPVG